MGNTKRVDQLADVMGEAAKELRSLHDQLGKANALCRIRWARIAELTEQRDELLNTLKRIAAGGLHRHYTSVEEEAQAVIDKVTGDERE